MSDFLKGKLTSDSGIITKDMLADQLRLKEELKNCIKDHDKNSRSAIGNYITYLLESFDNQIDSAIAIRLSVIFALSQIAFVELLHQIQKEEAESN